MGELIQLAHSSFPSSHAQGDSRSSIPSFVLSLYPACAARKGRATESLDPIASVSIKHQRRDTDSWPQSVKADCSTGGVITPRVKNTLAAHKVPRYLHANENTCRQLTLLFCFLMRMMHEA